jgi:hypothetical protein
LGDTEKGKSRDRVDEIMARSHILPGHFVVRSMKLHEASTHICSFSPGLGEPTLSVRDRTLLVEGNKAATEMTRPRHQVDRMNPMTRATISV